MVTLILGRPGLTLLEVAIGHIVLQTIILLTQTALMMVVLYYGFENPIVGKNVIWCVLFLVLVGTCGMFYGKIISVNRYIIFIFEYNITYMCITSHVITSHICVYIYLIFTYK